MDVQEDEAGEPVTEALVPLTAPDADSKALYLSAEPDLSMKDLEAKMAEMTLELGGIYGVEGRLKWLPKFGDHRSVRWCPDELRSMLDSHVTHSHRGGGTFSEADLKLASGHDLCSLRAVGVLWRKLSFAYEIVRPGEGWQDGCSEEELVVFTSRFLGKHESDVQESLEMIRSIPEYPKLLRMARLMNAYHTAEKKARGLLHAQNDVAQTKRHERDAARERYLHFQLSQALRVVGVEYRREEPDAD